jgi:hypothetical protein
MEKLRLTLFLFTLAITASFALSCGETSISGAIRQPQSITLSPATADAQDYPEEQVQFTATGHYNAAPYTVTPQPITAWAACQDGPTTDVSITAKGVAQCANGATGSYLITASSPGTCTCLAPCPSSDTIGTAQLTCP